jgi:outer membrane protein
MATCKSACTRVMILFGPALLFMGFLAASPAHSSEPAGVSVFQAIDVALEKNLGLKQSSNSVALEQIAVFKSRDSFLPNLDGSISPSLRAGREFDSLALRYEGTFSGSFQIGLSFSLTLFNGFYRMASLKAAKLTLSAGKIQHTREEQTVVYSTVTDYVQVVIDQELLIVYEENVSAQEKQLELIDAYFEAGKSPVADLFQQQAEVEQARQNLLSALSTLEVDKLRLLQTMGEALSGKIEIVPIAVPAEDAPWPEETAGEAVEFALAHRPDAESLKVMVAAAEKKVKAARSGWWPTISLFANAGTSYSSSMEEHFGFADQFLNNNPYLSVGLHINIPIFDGLSTKHAVDGAKLDVQAEQLKQETLAQSIELEVRQAFEDYKTALKQLLVTEKKLISAAQSLEAYEELYKAGGCTLVELSQARAFHVQASSDDIRARYDLLLKAVTLSYTKGDDEGMTALLKP